MRTFSNCVSFSLSSLETKQTRGKKPRNQVKSTHVSSNGHQCVKRRKHTHTKKKSWLLDSSMSLRKLEYKQASFSASFNYTMLLSWKSRLTALFYSCAFGHRINFCNATSSVPGNCYHSFLDKQRRTKWLLNEQLKSEL